MEPKNFIGIDWGNWDNRMVVSVINSDGQEIHREVFKIRGFSEFHRVLINLHCQFTPVVMLTENSSLGGISIAALQAEGFPIHGITLTHDVRRNLIEEIRRSFAIHELKLIKPIRFDYALINRDDEAIAVALSQ
jgi:hypothetical protein